MSIECPVEHCHAPDTTCSEGHKTLKACPYYAKISIEPKNQNEDGTSHNFPWNGNSLGLDNINLITSFTKPALIGLIGPYSSGKTTILATSYLMLFNGFDFSNQSFAGSLTLSGWEQISSYMQFQGYDEPTFPPHTPFGQGRTPGLLHLCLRKNEGWLNDILITDPPGEWFEKWADNVNDEDAAGARWIADNSTHFILLIDSELLIGDEAQIAKQDLFTLAERLASVNRSRPVAIAWTKTDINVSVEMRDAIVSRLDRLFTNKEYFDLSVVNNNQENLLHGFESLWKWLLTDGTSTNSSIVLPGFTGDYFLDYRG